MSFDVLIVGSGPSGVHAAHEAVQSGLRVGMVDVGYEDNHFARITPNEPWKELRQSDPEQHRYFLGDEDDGAERSTVDAGSHFTPAREYIVRGTADQLPVKSESFDAVQSLARGGLGAGWGAGCTRFTSAELRRIGLPGKEMSQWYEAVAGEIGISAPDDDDIANAVGQFDTKQPPHPLDSNAESIFNRYLKRKQRLNKRGFRLGQPPVAMLSSPKDDRGANPYHDMDYYGESAGSVWRPQHLLSKLECEQGFQYISPLLVNRFEEQGDGTVAVLARNLETGSAERIQTRRLLLAAGAINSARIVLRSGRKFDVQTPLLCNAYTYLPSINLGLLGKPVKDRRHSMIQLSGVFEPVGEAGDTTMVQFFSYRSLMLSRIARDMPLPPRLAMTLARAMVNCLTIVTVNHSDTPGTHRWMAMRSDSADSDYLEISSQAGEREDMSADHAIGKWLACYRACAYCQ